MQDVVFRDDLSDVKAIPALSHSSEQADNVSARCRQKRSINSKVVTSMDRGRSFWVAASACWTKAAVSDPIPAPASRMRISLGKQSNIRAIKIATRAGS